MTKASRQPTLALLVRSHPYQHRSARAELDLVLAALVMDYRVEVYFAGLSILQLAAERNSQPAQLPAGYRAWASLPDLGESSVFAEQSWLDRLAGWDTGLLMPVQGLNPEQFRTNWRHCTWSMVL